MSDADTLFRLSGLNAAYAAAIDADRLEDWPEFFTEKCLYKVTSADNHAKGYAAGIIFAGAGEAGPARRTGTGGRSRSGRRPKHRAGRRRRLRQIAQLRAGRHRTCLGADGRRRGRLTRRTSGGGAQERIARRDACAKEVRQRSD